MSSTRLFRCVRAALDAPSFYSISSTVGPCTAQRLTFVTNASAPPALTGWNGLYVGTLTEVVAPTTHGITPRCAWEREHPAGSSVTAAGKASAGTVPARPLLYPRRGPSQPNSLEKIVEPGISPARPLGSRPFPYRRGSACRSVLRNGNGPDLTVS